MYSNVVHMVQGAKVFVQLRTFIVLKRSCDLIVIHNKYVSPSDTVTLKVLYNTHYSNIILIFIYVIIEGGLMRMVRKFLISF